MTRQQPSLPVYEHLVTELAKVGQPWLVQDCEPGQVEETWILFSQGNIQWGLYPLQSWRHCGEGSYLLSTIATCKTKQNQVSICVSQKTLDGNLNQIRGKSRKQVFFIQRIQQPKLEKKQIYNQALGNLQVPPENTHTLCLCVSVSPFLPPSLPCVYPSVTAHNENMTSINFQVFYFTISTSFSISFSV